MPRVVGGQFFFLCAVAILGCSRSSNATSDPAPTVGSVTPPAAPGAVDVQRAFPKIGDVGELDDSPVNLLVVVAKTPEGLKAVAECLKGADPMANEECVERVTPMREMGPLGRRVPAGTLAKVLEGPVGPEQRVKVELADGLWRGGRGWVLGRAFRPARQP